MSEFRIFMESKADVKFVIDFISERFGNKLEISDFDTLNSWSGYKAGGGIEDAIQQNYDNGKQTILILDADNDYTKRYAEVTSDFQGYGIPVHLFLFPNSRLNGNLESLLTEIAVDRKLIDCFVGYEVCVKDYNLSLEKSRIYSYLDSILPENDKIKKNDLRKEENRNYRNTDHWNLHHEYLQPLHDFLSPFF